MTDRFVSLVAVKHEEHHDRSFLFEAPHSCGLKKGDSVIVDTKYGEALGKVTAFQSFVMVGSDGYNFILDAMGATEPLKKVVGAFKPYEYKEDN